MQARHLMYSNKKGKKHRMKENFLWVFTQKKAPTESGNPLSLIPAPALPGSGSTGIFSDRLNDHPMREKNTTRYFHK